MKVGVGVLIGIAIMLVICCICCIASALYLFNDPSFKEGYCQGYYEEAGSFRNEPFGLCRDYI